MTLFLTQSINFHVQLSRGVGDIRYKMFKMFHSMANDQFSRFQNHVKLERMDDYNMVHNIEYADGKIEMETERAHWRQDED